MWDAGKVASTFWSGETGRQIRAEGRNAQLLALYLVTCASANVCGCYYLPMVLASYETGITPEELAAAMHALESVGFCEYDAAKEYVWVPQMASFQIAKELKAEDTRIRAVQKVLEGVKHDKFRENFVGKYRDAFKLDIDRDFCPAHNRKSPARPATPAKVVPASDAFETFWEAYPRKTAKQAAAKAFKKLKPDDALLQTIMAALEKHKQSPGWQKDGGQFIPHASSWLNGHRWEDQLQDNGFFAGLQRFASDKDAQA